MKMLHTKYFNRMKALGITILFIIVLLGAGLFFVEENGNRVCGVAQKSDKQIEKLISSKSEVKGFSEALNFAGHPIPYDEKGTFYIYQNLDVERWQGVITSDAGKIYFLEDDKFKDKRGFISNNNRGKLYLIGLDSYEIFEVCFSGLPIMSVNRDRGVVEFLSAKGDGISSEEYRGNIEKRGGRSRRYEKKSFKLTFEEKQQLLDMRNDDDWILNALYDDMGLIHNAVSYDVWNQISKENDVAFDDTVRQEYIELLVDGDYRGVYGLTERIDNNFVGLKGKDIMYKAFGWPDWEKDCMEALECKYPKEETDEVKNFVKSDLMDFYTGDADYEKLKEKIYYQNALDFHIFVELTVGIDNMLKNSYLVYKYDEGDYKLAMIPWDCNATWGCHFQSYYADHYIQKTDVGSKQFDRLYEKDERTVSRDLYDEWIRLRRNGVITEENISAIAREYLDCLHSSGAYERNYERWPYVPEEEEFGPRLFKDEWKDEYIFEFIKDHVKVLDNYFEGLCNKCI